MTNTTSRKRPAEAGEQPTALGILDELLAGAGRSLPKLDADAPPPSPLAMTGLALLEKPWSELDRIGPGVQKALVEEYRRGRSHLHFLRSDSQPKMLRAVMRSVIPALVGALLEEVQMDTASARLLAEQAAEARADEAYYRMLAGIELDKAQITRADKLHVAADRHAKRMSRALEQLHRLRRPKVNVRIDSAKNVNLGDQRIVNESADTLDAHTSEHQGVKKRAAG